MRAKLNDKEQKKILDSVKGLMKLRRKRAIHISQSITRENGNGDKTTDNVIVSQDYYDKFNSSDDSADESVKSVDQLVREMSDNSEDDSTEELVETNKLKDDINNDRDYVLNIPHNQPLKQHCTAIEITSKENNNDQTSFGQRNEDHGFMINKKEDLFKNEAKHSIIESSLNICTESLKQLCANNETETPNCSNNVVIPDIDNIYKDLNEVCVKTNLIFNNDKNSKKENNSLLNNDRSNDDTESFFENNINQSINGNQSSENDKYSVQIEKTSQILCGKRLNTLEIVSFIPNTDDEVNLSSTKPNSNKIEEIPLQLPWIKPYTKEDFHNEERFD